MHRAYKKMCNWQKAAATFQLETYGTEYKLTDTNREKGREVIWESTGSYLSIFLLGKGWNGRGKSSGGDRKSERGWACTHTLCNLKPNS